MKKEMSFPEEVLEFLKELEDGDARLPIMRTLTTDEAQFKRMWQYLLKAPRTDLYASMSNKQVVEFFVGMVINCMKDEIPVFYFNEKQKKDKIAKIGRHQNKLTQIYDETFGKNSDAYKKELIKNTNKAIEEINKSHLRVGGTKQIKKVKAFVMELAQRNIWIYGKHLNSVIRAAVLAVYGHHFESDVSIHKLLARMDKEFCAPLE